MRYGFLAGLAVLVTPVLLAGEPGLPCGEGPGPAYPQPGAPPITRVWATRDSGWVPPSCTGWGELGYTTLVAIAATVRLPEGDEDLLRRIGAISELAGVRYWSSTHGRWQTLILGARALRGPSVSEERADFAPRELALGKDLYFRQEDNLAGKAVYRLRVLDLAPDHVVFETENVTPIRYLFVTLFGPRELQSIYFLSRQSPHVWRYYNLSRTGAKASRLTSGHEASSLNRAVALFRHYAGIPTDQEPPAAP